MMFSPTQFMKPFIFTLTCLPFLLFPGFATADDVTANNVTAPSVLIAKFNFETTDSVAKWHEDRAATDPPNRIALDTDSPHSGNADLEYTATTDWSSPRTIYTGIAVPDGTGARRLRLRFFARSKGTQSGDVQVSILERDQTQVIGWADGKPSEPVTAPDQWQENVVEVPISAATKVITLFFGLKKPVAGQSFWLDDVSVELVSPPAQ